MRGWKIILVIFILMLSIFAARDGFAQRSFGRFLKPNVGKLFPIFTFTYSAYPTEAVKNQAANLSAENIDFRLFTPLWQNEQNDFSIAGLFQSRIVETTGVLGTSGTPLPNDLWNIEIGPAYRHRFKNNWILGANLLMGSASDKPFDSYHELELMTNFFLRIPDDGDAWIIFLNYSNNRDFLNYYPIPGFAYSLESAEWVEGIVGIPIVSLTFLPKEKVSIHTTYFPLVNVSADITYKPIPFFALYTGYSWSNERYLRSGRPDNRSRFFNYEMRAFGGVKLRPTRWMEIDAGGGYAFNRFYFEARRFTDRNNDRTNIDAAPFAKVQMTFLMMSPYD